MSASAPGVQCEPKAAFYWAIGLIPARMPQRLPLHEVVGHIELFRIDFRTRVQQVDVLLHQVEGVHSQLRGKIIERAHGEYAHLRMVWSTPSARRSDMVYHANVLFLLIRYLPDIRNGK